MWTFLGGQLTTPVGRHRLALPVLNASPDTAPRPSRSAFLRHLRLWTYLSAVLKENWAYCSLPSARRGKPAQVRRGSLVGRAMTTGSRCRPASALLGLGRGAPSRGERGPWAGPGRGGLGAGGGAGAALPHSLHFAVVAAGESPAAPQVPLRWGSWRGCGRERGVGRPWLARPSPRAPLPPLLTHRLRRGARPRLRCALRHQRAGARGDPSGSPGYDSRSRGQPTKGGAGPPRSAALPWPGALPPGAERERGSVPSGEVEQYLPPPSAVPCRRARRTIRGLVAEGAARDQSDTWPPFPPRNGAGAVVHPAGRASSGRDGGWWLPHHGSLKAQGQVWCWRGRSRLRAQVFAERGQPGPGGASSASSCAGAGLGLVPWGRAVAAAAAAAGRLLWFDLLNPVQHAELDASSDVTLWCRAPPPPPGPK